MKKSIKVTLDEKTIEVKKLPIGEYVDLIRAVKKLPKHLKNLDNLDVEKIIEILPEITSDGLPDLLGIISIAVKLPYKEIVKLGLDEIILLVKAVYEVNNYKEVVEMLKKALAHPAVQKAAKVVQKTS